MRRHLVALAGSLLAATLVSAQVSDSPRPQLERLLERARAHSDPWVLLHAESVRTAAAGPSPALRRALAAHVSPVRVGGSSLPAFSSSAEAHPFQGVHLLRRSGFDDGTRFESPHGAFTLAELARASRLRFDPSLDPLELPWAVSVLVAEMPGGEGRFETATGASVAIDDLVRALLAATETVYSELAHESPERSRAIDRAACNGTHLIAGLLAATRHGYATGDRGERIRALLHLALERVEHEPARLDRRFGRRGTRFYAAAGKLTFLGHTLELAREAEAAGFVLGPAEVALVARAERELARAVDTLVTRFDLDAIEALNPRAVAIALGDAAHALRALSAGP